ncbi:MAG TPA: ASCH domain-containing protein [Flavisolibacter sp.]|nr:ASCH domain-containing protein [Flavisolibacter sp.]
MNTLHLTLKKQWFDLIASGEKKEEYREIKEFWWRRLTHGKYCIFNEYDTVCFRHGYAKNAPTVTVKCNGIVIAKGKEAWGAEQGVDYFVISLGEILSAQK